MVHLNIAPPLEAGTNEVHDPDCQHAFMLVGTERVFAVHMTQFHCEKHKYQLILHIDLPKEELAEYRRQRALYPEDTFVLSNYMGEDEEDLFSIPQLGSFSRKTFKSVIHRGFRPPVDPNEEYVFPWKLRDTIPVIDKFETTVKRVVHFRPFAHNERTPDFANYILWGHGDEAHMTNVQYATLMTGPHEPPLFGLDNDHVMSLVETPKWLSSDMLEAGIVVTLPAIRRTDPDTGQSFLLSEPPFEQGDKLAVMYRGLQPPRYVVAGPTFLWGSAVLISPELTLTTPNVNLIMSPMPKKYWR